MQKILILKKGLLVTVCGLAVVLSGCASRNNVFVVDIQTGLDGNPGTPERPFKTIQRAQTAVRQTLAGGMQGDVVVQIRPGQYYLQSPLVFDHRDSGRNGYRVIYRGTGDRQPELIGGTPLTGWELYKDGIYKASVPAGRTFRNLMENGELSILARTPNDGYYAAAKGTKSGTEKSEPVVVFEAGQFNRFDFEDAQVMFWGGRHPEWDGGKNWNWFLSAVPVATADFESNSIYLKFNPLYTMWPENRYYARGAMAFLDQPGEFFLDRKDGVVYYIPRQLPIEKQSIVAAASVHLIEVHGKSIAEPVGNIIFENLKLQLSDTINYSSIQSGTDSDIWYRESNCDGLLFLKNAKNVTVKKCWIRNAGMSAIAMLGANQGHQITDNLIEDALHNGLSIWGYYLPDKEIADETQGYINKGHTISNNYIRNCGKLIGHACGVEIVQAGDIEVSHNLIEKMPRYAISVFSIVFSELSITPTGAPKVIYGKEVTWENRYDYLFTRNISVLNNECREVMRETCDGSAINFYGVGTGNRIENNFVHTLKPEITDSILSGIYLDDHSNGFLVRNNIVCRLFDARYIVPIFVKGIGNMITNNIIADNESSWGNIQILETPIGDFDFLPQAAQTEKTRDNRIEKNIFYRNKGTEIYFIYPISESIVQMSDYNLFYHTEGKYEVRIDWVNHPFDYWKNLYGKGYDAHSLFADPLFVEPDKMNYKLKPESPALDLGFKDIDVSAVGLKDNFPFKVN